MTMQTLTNTQHHSLSQCLQFDNVNNFFLSLFRCLSIGADHPRQTAATAKWRRLYWHYSRHHLTENRTTIQEAQNNNYYWWEIYQMEMFFFSINHWYEFTLSENKMESSKFSLVNALFLFSTLLERSGMASLFVLIFNRFSSTNRFFVKKNNDFVTGHNKTCPSCFHENLLKSHW